MTHSQTVFKMPREVKKETVRFQLINNLIILPVELNGKELSFILDTGVNKPILFNLTENDTVQVEDVEEIYIRGLGEGDAIKAYHSKGNHFKINSIYNNNQDLYLVLDEEMNLSPRLGIDVHGIIGFDLIKDFILDINYQTKKITFYKSYNYKYKKCRKCQEFDLELYKNKPYVISKVAIENTEEIDAKLLIDSGSSDALWLFEDDENGITVPSKQFEDFLGRGLSGSIYGKRSRVNSFRLGKFKMKEAKVSFPDSISIQYINGRNNRKGSLGAEILKRFNIILDYQAKKITLKKNGNFNAPFKYNMSGIEVEQNGTRYAKELRSDDDASGRISTQIFIGSKFKIALRPAIEIVEIREGSPADIAGIQKKDLLLAINGKQTHRYSLQEINELLNEKEGKVLRLLIEREGVELTFYFQLKRVL